MLENLKVSTCFQKKINYINKYYKNKLIDQKKKICHDLLTQMSFQT